MKCKILHETTGRLRVHLCCGRMTVSQADVLEYYLRAQDGVQEVRVYDRTQDAVVLYDAERGSILRALAVFSFAKAEAMELVPEHTSRALNREFEDKLAVAVMRRCISKLFLPAPITTALAVFRSVKYIREGLSALWHGKLSVAVLDATAVTVSMARGDFATAGSVMFMLHLGEILEEWTHKKSVADLASAMSLRVDSVWLQVNGTEVLTKITDVKPGDRIVIRTGGMIPLDGRVVEGEAMVNQSSLTGESMPVAKHPGSPVYAGTVAEEGECVISVEKSSGSGRYDRVVRMIEESEKLKSTAEDKASRMADRLVPYTLGGTALTYLLTRNVTKMLSVLMVDFSCALKLAIPIAVLSAMRESSGAGKRICSASPPAWRSITPIPWQTPWWRRQSGTGSPTRSTIRRCSMWWPTASPVWWRARRSSSAAPTLSLRTRAVASWRESSRNLTRCPPRIPTCTSAWTGSWRRSSASTIPCAGRRGRR